MKLYDYCDAINAQLEVRRYACQGNRWTASFENCDIRENGLLKSAYGTGPDPSSAIADYINEIAGKTIVFDAMSVRRIFNVPKDIEP